MVERRLPRDFGALEGIFGFIREFLGERGINSEAAYDLDVIAEELFTNMVKYAHGGNPDIAIALDWNAPAVTMRVRDFDVEPFDPTRAPPLDTTLPIEARRAGGLGLHLVRQIADQIEYTYSDRSSTITVTKRLGG